MEQEGPPQWCGTVNNGGEVSVGSLRGDLLPCLLKNRVDWTLNHIFKTVKVCESDTRNSFLSPVSCDVF